MKEFEVALDNCVDVSIFMTRDLLEGIQKEEDTWIVTGHAEGVEITMTEEEGAYKNFKVMSTDNATCNVLCQVDIVRLSDVYEIPSWGIRVITSGGPLNFVMNNKRYVLDTRKPVKINCVEFEKLWQDKLREIGHVTAEYHATTKTVKGEAARFTLNERK